MNFFDLVGAFFSLICTYLFVLEDKRAWFLSAIAIPFDAYVYYRSQLYGDMMLQGIYFISTLYGWYQWQYGGKNHQELAVSRLSIKAVVICLLLVMIGIGLISPLLKPFNQAEVAMLDAITTVLSLLGQALLCLKKIETWLIWFMVDSLYIYLYAIKALPFHSLMALVYLFMAVAGGYRWYFQVAQL